MDARHDAALEGIELMMTSHANTSDDDVAPAALPGQIWRLPELMSYFGESRTAIYRLRRDPAFPAPVPITKQTVGWIATEVIAFQGQRLAMLRPLTPVSPLDAVPTRAARSKTDTRRPKTNEKRPTATSRPIARLYPLT